MSAVMLPGLDVGARPWMTRSRSDQTANVMANRHYSRRHPARLVGGPYDTIVLVTPDESATWVSIHPLFPQDGLYAWRCSIFRNEGPQLSSGLILEAMAITAELWAAPPPDGWVTFVDTAEVKSANPGYCFKQAGWWLDKSYVPNRRRPTLIRLRAAA